MSQTPVLNRDPSGRGKKTFCEKCSAFVDPKQGWCGSCGWYPRLEIFLDLDPWEKESANPDKAKKKPSKLQVFRTMVPRWAWKMLAGVGIVLAVSILARLLLPVHGPYRFAWTIAQMSVGTIVMFSAYLACYLFAALENDRLGLLDFIIKPFAIIIAVAGALPTTFWRVAFCVWGLSMIWCSYIVGGFAHRDLMDWGGTPARVNLVRAIADQAEQQANGYDSLQDAVEAIAKQDPGAAEPSTPAPGQPKILVDCLIIGFEPLGEHDFNSLVLATEVQGKLQFAGTVSTGIPQEVRDDLNKRMRKFERPDPFIPCRLPATWLKPKLVCRVSIKEFSSTNKLVRPVFKEMLNDISVKQ